MSHIVQSLNHYDRYGRLNPEVRFSSIRLLQYTMKGILRFLFGIVGGPAFVLVEPNTMWLLSHLAASNFSTGYIYTYITHPGHSVNELPLFPKLCPRTRTADKYQFLRKPKTDCQSLLDRAFAYNFIGGRVLVFEARLELVLALKSRKVT